MSHKSKVLHEIILLAANLNIHVDNMAEINITYPKNSTSLSTKKNLLQASLQKFTQTEDANKLILSEKMNIYVKELQQQMQSPKTIPPT